MPWVPLLPAGALTVVAARLADRPNLAVAAGVAALVLVAASSVTGRGGFLTVGGLLLVLQAALVLVRDSTGAWWAVAWAVGLFGVLETTELVLERRHREAGSTGPQWQRFGILAATIATLAAGVVLVGLMPFDRGILVQAAAAGALAVLAFGSVAALSARKDTTRRSD